jgi:S-DNA-T family DNA segregation ATPase FtsK/SpoIIIE
LPVGPGGDEGATVGVDLQPAGGLLVVGPPGSGRSSALRAFARHLSSAGATVGVLAAAPPRPHDQDRAQPGASGQLDRADADGLRAWLAGRHPGADPGRPVVVVADDVTSLPDAVADVLGSATGPGRPVLVLAAGTAADLAASFRGPAVSLRRSRTALVLRPAAGEAELLGLRTPRTPLPARPGAGWLVTPGGTVRVQVARRRLPGPG